MAEQHIVAGPVAVAEFAGGASRYLYKGSPLPEGCTNLVHLLAVGLVAIGEPEQEPEQEPVAVVEKSIDDMKVDELKAYAAQQGIELGEARVKPEILAAIKAATEPGPDAAGDRAE